jgi:hypothetical protein
LRKLLEAGAVVALAPVGEGRRSFEYVVNHQHLFMLLEELREVAERAPDKELRGETVADGRVTHVGRPQPRLVLTRGLREGTTYSLAPPEGAAEHVWVLGRKRGLDVSVDYDPFVSSQNSRIMWTRPGGYVLEDLAGNRNGTMLNYERLSPGGRAALTRGDIVGIGRTAFVFQA